jgi:hypothetical protein
VLYPRLGNGVARLPFVLFIGTAMGIPAFRYWRAFSLIASSRTREQALFAILCAAVDDATALCLLGVTTVISRPEVSDARWCYGLPGSVRMSSF